MLILGIICIVAAIVLIVLGIVNVAVHALLWVGILVALVAVALIVAHRMRGRSARL